uniref:DNA cross-link repair 1A protein n=1 Tax=Kwoniella bestiolae CBS 10118 TaxID=1296100 RepID=A0A1B9FUH2_9TREE|nr:DNA cross-link repair 1A protein [Kwoniella bestiolae CBS 10118]OCF22418.1 DNA cross-link repair 1A protein [Kwoniella bestiolae CBS 10118]
MAKGSTKSAKQSPSANTGNILSFFSKTPTPRRTSSASKNGFCEKVEDVKPVIADRKGKGKATFIIGSVEDPVVISDDEDILPVSPPTPSNKKRKLSNISLEAGPSKSPQPARPPPFPGYPDFKPPPTWPEVINVGDVQNIEDDDEEDIPPSDEDHHRNQDPEDGDDAENDDSGLDMDIERQDMPEPIEPETPQGATPSKHFSVGDIDMTEEWEEPEDEGMGMEEDGEGDDEGSVMSEPINRNRGRGSKAIPGGKMSECPVCGKSLKGQNNDLAQHHINSCLDSSSSSPKSSKKARPISSYASFSTEPSPSPEPEQSTKGPNAFSVLMSGHKEKDQWKDAEADLKRDGKRFVGRRKAPFYKVMTGMPVAVDAFRYGAIPKVTAYLHAHSDHYTNLSKSWTHGPIYCSETTANLIVHMLGVEPKWVHGLPDNVPFEMPNTGGVTVTPMEANHCPGSSIFLFEGPQTVNAGDSGFRSPYVGSKKIFRYLHCGDFRACPKMVLHSAIARAPVHTCYLDTTYLNPKYCFPPQPQVIDACASLARKMVVGISLNAPDFQAMQPKVYIKAEEGQEIKPDPAELAERSKAMMAGWLVKKEDSDVKEELKDINDIKPKGRTLVVMGTYSIGKERIVKAVAKALGSTIYCDPRKKGILLCQTDPELHAMLSTDPISSQVHLLPLGNIQLDRMQPYLARLHPHFDRVLAFRPTGWTYTPPAGTDMLPDVNTVIKRDQARWFSEKDLKEMRGSCRTFQLFGVPYSEHSSFTELTCFSLSIPGPDLKMIATVNVGNEKSRAKMKKWFEKWAAEKARRREKGLPAIVDYRDETYVSGLVVYVSWGVSS